MPISSSGIRTPTSSVDPARLQQRHKLTPYAGRSLFGRVQTTFVRGERVWDENGSRARTAGDCYERSVSSISSISRRSASAAPSSPPTTSSSRRRSA